MKIFSAILCAAALVGTGMVWAGEYTGHYSGPMDIEGLSAERVNDGDEGMLITLEDLDQKTVHNVLKKATRPEAADLVREMTIEQGGVYVGEEAAMKRKAAAEAKAAGVAAAAAAPAQAPAPAPRVARKAVRESVIVAPPAPEAGTAQAKVTEKVTAAAEEAREAVQGGVQNTNVSLQEAIDLLDHNPKLIRGHEPQMPEK